MFRELKNYIVYNNRKDLGAPVGEATIDTEIFSQHVVAGENKLFANKIVLIRNCISDNFEFVMELNDWFFLCCSIENVNDLIVYNYKLEIHRCEIIYQDLIYRLKERAV